MTINYYIPKWRSSGQEQRLKKLNPCSNGQPLIMYSLRHAARTNIIMQIHIKYLKYIQNTIVVDITLQRFKNEHKTRVYKSFRFSYSSKCILFSRLLPFSANNFSSNKCIGTVYTRASCEQQLQLKCILKTGVLGCGKTTLKNKLKCHW